MRFNRLAVATTLLAGLALAGCQSTKQALGITKVTPDEFRVVSVAPLVVPPDYSLRPPAPGEPRPQELQPESQARIALLGQEAAVQRSEGEKLLVSKAGGDHADPLVRYVVDDQFGAIAHKEPGFANWVIFWRRGKPPVQPAVQTNAQAGGDTSTPIDPAVEAARIQKLTGGQTIVISRQATSERNKIKLPGL
ncbi:MAG TPA: DUF3035 domain-containing protein [Caulobacteraceae bacterium]|nr:DUF3035 domain-containing protein [Caulobacteraceae bacterium]